MCRHIRPSLLPTAIILLVVGVMPSAEAASEPDYRTNTASELSSVNGNDTVEEANGPTILLGYDEENRKQNPISSFMYFVPLVSQTLVETQTSPDNEQRIGVVSYEMKATKKSFKVVCELEISGKGVHKTAFDPVDMIRAHIHDVKEGEALTNMLDYIMFEDEGLARIEVRGAVTASGPVIEEVRMQLNAGGHKSPVTIGLYDVRCRDGEYRYENRSNEVVARVNRLVFKKAEETPKMGVEVATLADKGKSAGLLGFIKGVIANLILEPPAVAPLGNEAVLAFGGSLVKKEPAFTFPKAENITEDRVVGMDLAQK